MSDLRTRTRPPAGGAARSPRGRAPEPDQTVRPLPVTALLAAAAVAGGGLLVALGLAVTGWMVAGAEQDVSAALRAGAQGWLLAHGAPLEVAGVRWTLVPLGVTLLLGYALMRAARWTAASRAGAEPVERLLGAVVLIAAYLAGTVLVAVLASRPGAEVDLVGTLWRGGLLVALAVAHGTLQAGPPWRTLLPRWLVGVLETAAVVVLAVLTLSALLLAVALAAGLGEAATLMGGLGLDGGGGLMLGLVLLLSLPNAVLWAAAYLLGPGFSLGLDTVVSAQQVVAGPVPAYPLLAAVPSQAAPTWLAVVLLAVPVLVGAAAGAAVCRRHGLDDWRRAAGLGLGGGALGALVLAGLVAVSAGSAGSGRLSEVGPSGTAVLLAAILPLALGAAAGAVGRVLVDRRPARGPVSTADEPTA